MTEFRGEKMSLFLFLLLQFTAVTEQYSLRVVASDGDEVTLPCKNGIDHQDTCDGTSWLFNRRSSSSVNLVTDGKIKENLKSDRLNVTENCSLVIKKVTVEDVGFYTCRVSRSDTNVYLFLITITEQENNNKKMLSCSMSAYEACDFMMNWLYEGKDVTEVKDMETSQSECSVTVTFPASYFKQKSKYHESFKCKVKHPLDTEDHQFYFSPEKPGKEAAATTTTTTTTLTARTILTARAPEDSNKTRTNSTEHAKNDWWLYVVAAGGAALIVLVLIIVVVIRCKRTKGKKAQMDENTGEPLNPAVAESAPETRQDTADPDDGVSYASVSYIKRTNKAKVKNDDDDEGDTVTYSTVRASSSAAAAAACDDPSSLYAAIKKPN